MGHFRCHRCSIFRGGIIHYCCSLTASSHINKGIIRLIVSMYLHMMVFIFIWYSENFSPCCQCRVHVVELIVLGYLIKIPNTINYKLFIISLIHSLSYTEYIFCSQKDQNKSLRLVLFVLHNNCLEGENISKLRQCNAMSVSGTLVGSLITNSKIFVWMCQASDLIYEVWALTNQACYWMQFLNSPKLPHVIFNKRPRDRSTQMSTWKIANLRWFLTVYYVPKLSSLLAP